NGASPVSAAQIPLPPSRAEYVQKDESIGKAKEKKGPTAQQSWEKLMAEVEKYDEGTVKNWKEDIDTLLVF
ncbi:hypothetical protein Moror_5358, partial [Moniliophthora roreri MCA 2997]